MTPSSDTLSHYLRSLRGELSQAAAAEKSGVRRRQWIGWEAEGKGIAAPNARKIASAFRRPPEELLRFVSVRLKKEQLEDALAQLEDLDQRVKELEDDRARARAQRRAPARRRSGGV